MEDMASKLTRLLEDDKSVDMIKNFSSMLKGKEEGSGMDIGKIAELSSAFKDDDRIGLMKALRPFVSESKRESLDSLTNMLRLVKLVSILSQMNLF